MKNYLTKFINYEHLTILLIGDSTTSQEWTHPNWYDFVNYTFRQDENWDQAWKRKIINVARDGATFVHYLKYYDSEIKRFKPDLIIESLGINSIIPDLDIEKTKNEIRSLNKRILDDGYELACWSYQLGAKEYQKRMRRINGIQKEIAIELQYQFIDICSEFEKYDLLKLFTFSYPWRNDMWRMKTGDIDFLHCNEVGNQIIAENLLKEIFNKNINPDTFGTMKLLDLPKYLH